MLDARRYTMILYCYAITVRRQSRSNISYSVPYGATPRHAHHIIAWHLMSCRITVRPPSAERCVGQVPPRAGGLSTALLRARIGFGCLLDLHASCLFCVCHCNRVLFVSLILRLVLTLLAYVTCVTVSMCFAGNACQFRFRC